MKFRLIEHIKPFSLREVIGISVLFLIVFTMVFSSRYHRIYKDNAIFSEENRVLIIEESVGLNKLAEKLYEKEVVTDTVEFIWAGNLLGWRNFRPGRYETGEGYDYNEFLSKLARGIQDETKVTIIPGLDEGLISRNLGLQLQADSAAFASIFSDSSSIALEVGLTKNEILGRMLPESYFFFWTTEPENVIRRILNEFERIVTRGLSEEIEKSGFTLNEVLTLASIVEWEAKVQDEKRRISGLYLNRLERNMRLQADPTVLYALGEKRRVLFEDYRLDHPYNTYMVDGLPPGPITNPDLRSIKAVLNPEKHDYLYMVATPEGSHQFSRTFEEHKQASENWRQFIREQIRIRRALDREKETQVNR